MNVAYFAAETASFLNSRFWCLRGSFRLEDVIPPTNHRRGQTKHFCVFLDEVEYLDSYGGTCHVNRTYQYSGVYFIFYPRVAKGSEDKEEL